jgi:Zn-dependent protease with chaperone function
MALQDIGFAKSIMAVMLIPPALLIVILGLTVEHISEPFQYCSAYVAGIVALVTYGSWPPLDAIIARDYARHYRTITPLYFVVITIGTLFFLWVATQFLQPLVGKRSPDETHADAPGTPHSRAALVALVIPLWLVAVYTQVRCIVWAYERFTHHALTLLDYAWPVPLMLAYVVLALRAVRNAIAVRRQVRDAPAELACRCMRLANSMGMRPPLVAVTDSRASTAQRTLLTGPVVTISLPRYNVLTEEERNALLAHELAHLKRDSLTFAVLELLSAMTLCGQGLLSMLVDPIQREYDADSDAAQSLGPDGARIMQSMLGGLAGTRMTAQPATLAPGPPSRSRLVLELFCGDGGLWYRHPTSLDRAKALTARCVW